MTTPVPLLITLTLSCAGPAQSDEQPSPGLITPSPPISTPTKGPLSIPAPTPPPDTPPRGGSVRFPGGRTAPVVRIVPRDVIPAVFDPVHIPPADVGEQAGEAGLVIGVSIGAESVAYSVPYLSSREVVNDTVGGTPIVVTW